MQIAFDGRADMRRVSFPAIASVICGVISWLIVPFIGVVTIGIFGAFAIFAVLLGHAARRSIRRSDGTRSGSGLARAGLILGYGQIAVSTTLIVLLIANATGQ